MCITPEDPTDFATQLGRALSGVHAHDASPLLHEVMAAAFPVDGPTAAFQMDAWVELAKTGGSFVSRPGGGPT